MLTVKQNNAALGYGNDVIDGYRAPDAQLVCAQCISAWFTNLAQSDFSSFCSFSGHGNQVSGLFWTGGAWN
jgi:hypothetical protein